VELLEAPPSRCSELGGATCLSVVVPAYNEEESICEVVSRIESIRLLLQAVGVADLEVVVVDDGSKDHTAELVRALPGVRLICHEVNKGYGGALKTGFECGRGDLLAFLDADGTYPPEQLPALCREALAGADMVVGSRRSGATSQMPPVRRLGNFVWSNMVSLLGNHQVLDPASGMRVFWRRTLTTLSPLPDGLNLTPVMSTRAVHEGLNVVEVPIPYSERAGRSKLNVVRDGLRFGNSIVWTALAYNPVRILGSIGLALTSTAAAIALWLVLLRLQGITTLDAWGVFGAFTATTLVVVGVSTFTLGATFNYLVSLFHVRPIRQGLFGRPLLQVPLERHFGWIGLLGMAGGLVLGLTALGLGLNGWPVTRIWLYFLASALAVILGVQLTISWIIMRILEELRDASH
jgi:hypothetical protein